MACLGKVEGLSVRVIVIKNRMAWSILPLIRRCCAQLWSLELIGLALLVVCDIQACVGSGLADLMCPLSC